MRTLTLMTLVLAACLQATGCCGPMMGPGCGIAGGNCYDCEGGFGPRHMATGPIDALRNARRSLVCGGGCSEVYYGEWMSTPPDCADPCCGSEFVGGATKCAPFCWQPGALLGNFYGRRFDDCCNAGCDSCATCDDCGCEGDLIDGGEMGSACPSCSAGMMQSGTSQVVRSSAMPRSDRMTMQQTQAPSAPQKQQMRSAQMRPQQQQVRMKSPARPMQQQPMTRSAQMQMATEEQSLRR